MWRVRQLGDAELSACTNIAQDGRAIGKAATVILRVGHGRLPS